MGQGGDCNSQQYGPMLFVWQFFAMLLMYCRPVHRVTPGMNIGVDIGNRYSMCVGKGIVQVQYMCSIRIV